MDTADSDSRTLPDSFLDPDVYLPFKIYSLECIGSKKQPHEVQCMHGTHIPK